jgi:hypothetical protein
MRDYLRFIPLICFAGLLHAQIPTLEVTREESHLRVAAPQLHFLEGKSLEKLHNGAPVTYVFEVTLGSDQSDKTLAHLRERFIISFDLWEERFAVVQAAPPGRAGSHFTAAAAESWCLSNIQIPVPPLTPEKTFVIKLECWAEEGAGANVGDSDSGLTLSGLIDVFSRKGRDTQTRWEAASGLLRLGDIKTKKSEIAPPRGEKPGGTRRLHLNRGTRGRL